MEVYISDSVKYIGVDDTTIDLFESQYVVPEGVSYNSYVILDEKTALMDTVDARGAAEWEANLKAALNGRALDYLVISHMEPDHAGSIGRAKCKDFPVFESVFRERADTGKTCRKRRRHINTWFSYSYFCHGANGTLAGGYGCL